MKAVNVYTAQDIWQKLPCDFIHTHTHTQPMLQGKTNDFDFQQSAYSTITITFICNLNITTIYRGTSDDSQSLTCELYSFCPNFSNISQQYNTQKVTSVQVSFFLNTQNIFVFANRFTPYTILFFIVLFYVKSFVVVHHFVSNSF